MNLEWMKTSDHDDYKCVYGDYTMEISRWGRRNWAWKVFYKDTILATSHLYGNADCLKRAKDKCRYHSSYHITKLEKQQQQYAV